MAKIFIIDVSHHQGVIDWEKVKPKIGGAIINCGYGNDTAAQDDKQFRRNLAECERLGIPHGVYLYSYARTTVQAKSELAHILRLIKGHTFQLPIFLDVEEDGTQTFAATACRIVCDGLKAAGYTPGVYANLSWWNGCLRNVTAYPRWVAQWSNKCTYIGEYIMWQYTETGRIDGVSGYVDCNYYYGTIGKAETPKPIAVKKSVDEIAAEVISGKWGNGGDRKARLTLAGYDYTAVQNAVNALLAKKKKSIDDVAREVIRGKWGNGNTRKYRLIDAGYDYDAVQKRVNELMR